MDPEISETTTVLKKEQPKEEDRSKHLIVVTCNCGFSMTCTIYGPMENYQNCVGTCRKCGSNKMSIKCSKKIEELAA